MMRKNKRVIIHDLPNEVALKLFVDLDDEYIVFNAKKPAANCVGCFECWLKEPGKCKFDDNLENIGTYILASKELIIFSEVLYGGVSIPIKRILDRSIPGITPFFKKRFGKLHHYRRYQSYTQINAYFYNTKMLDDKELQQVKKYIEAMGTNYYSEKNSVNYISDMDFSEVDLCIQ